MQNLRFVVLISVSITMCIYQGLYCDVVFEPLPKIFRTHINHFSENRVGFMDLKYFIYDTSFVQSSPLLIEVADEDVYDGYEIFYYPSYAMAKKLHATLILIEHRSQYIARMIEEDDSNLDNLQYVSVEQTVEDLAAFIESYKENTTGLEKSKVGVFGCSYGGTLAIWLRYKFPHLVEAAWASSAPMEMTLSTNTFDLFDAIRRLYKNESQKCFDILIKGFDELKSLFRKRTHNQARFDDYISKLNNWYCGDATNMTENEVLYKIVEIISYASKRVNYINSICTFLINKRSKTNLRQLIRLLVMASCESCNNALNYQTYWYVKQYQMCTEFGYPYELVNKFYPFQFSNNSLGRGLTNITRLCSKLSSFFNVTDDMYRKATSRRQRDYDTNFLSNVISIHGENDPFLSLSINYTCYLEEKILKMVVKAPTLDAFEDTLRRYLGLQGEENNRVEADTSEILRIIQISQLFGNKKGKLSAMSCAVCEILVRSLINAFKWGTERRVTYLLVKICALKFTKEVCRKILQMHYVPISYFLNITPNITGARVCSIVFQKFGCRDENRVDWKIKIPSYKPQKKRKSRGKYQLKIIQLTDLHYDPSYEPDTNAVCGDPICCQKGSKPVREKNKAGFWGDYRKCNTPKSTYVNLLRHIANTHQDVDYIYFTGDIITHKFWDTSKKSNTEAIVYVVGELRKILRRIPIFPVLGNHEAHPVNVFYTNLKLVNTEWLFKLVKTVWRLPKETEATIMKGGFYTILVKPGFRIVALNNNVCYILNWWLLHNDSDPYDQLKWLVAVLFEAEKNEEIVHILAHVPMHDRACMNNWITEYEKIVNRFAHIIAAQFNGHTHFDQTVIVYNSSNCKEAINVAWNGGSIVTYRGYNPNYKVYHVDSKSMEVVDVESWTFNLTRANAVFWPEWHKLYSFKQAYGLDNLSLEELEKLPFHIARNSKLGYKYFRFGIRDADSEVFRECNSEYNYYCRWRTVCDMISTPKRRILCARLKKLVYSRSVTEKRINKDTLTNSYC